MDFMLCNQWLSNEEDVYDFDVISVLCHPCSNDWSFSVIFMGLGIGLIVKK